jgi:hypothetical protein
LPNIAITIFMLNVMTRKQVRNHMHIFTVVAYCQDLTFIRWNTGRTQLIAWWPWRKEKKQQHTFLICCYFLTVSPSLMMSSGQLHHHGGSSSHLMFWSIHTIGITHCRELNSTSHNIQIKFNENQCSRSQVLHVYRQLDKVNFIGSPQRCCEHVYKATVCL